MRKKYLFLFLIFINTIASSQISNNKIQLQNISLITNTPLLQAKNLSFNLLSSGKLKFETSYDEVKFMRAEEKFFHVYDKNKKLLKTYSNGINLILYNYENQKLVSSVYYTDMYFNTNNHDFINQTDELLKSHNYILNKTFYSYDGDKIINKKVIKKDGEETLTNFAYDSKNRINLINGYAISYDDNDNIILIEGIKKDFIVDNHKVFYSEASRFIHDNSLLKNTQKVFKTNYILHVVDSKKAIEKRIPLTPLVAKSLPILKLQGVKVQFIKNNIEDWEIEEDIIHEYEFNEFNDWIEKKSYKENLESKKRKPVEGEFRNFSNV